VNPVICLVALWACGTSVSPVADPGVALAGVSLSSPDGETHVAATRAQVREDGQGAAEGVTGTLAADGAPPLEVTASRSTWDLRTRTVVLEGDVVALRGGTRITCDQATVLFDASLGLRRQEMWS
jgi:hypothetical protein